jgi:L-threonylcarbamoyladenylate synthase
MMKTLTLPADDPLAIPRALEILAQGGLAAFPTDTVYGLGGLAFDPHAIQEIYQVKGRSIEKAIPILVGAPEQLPLVAPELNPLARRLAERFWPGPLTLVVPKHPGLPPELSIYPTVGVRMPAHPAALALLQRSGPLAVTSANLSGQANATTAEEVQQQLDGRIALVLDGGRTPGGLPSTVVDCSGPQPHILRPGPISQEEILSALQP